MSKLNINRPLLGLLILLVAILFINPHIFMNLYTTVLGRIVLIIFVILLAMHSLTFGLLAALIVIISAQLAFREGLESSPSGPTGSTSSTSSTSSSINSMLSSLSLPTPSTTSTTIATPAIAPMPATTAPSTTTPSTTTPSTTTPSTTTPSTTVPVSTSGFTTKNRVDKITMSELLRPKSSGHYTQGSEEIEPVASNGHGFKSSYSSF